ncbi:MAG: ketopantoate reductase family protein [Cypionkella sp.]
MQGGLGAPETIRAVMGPAVPVYASAMMIGLQRQGQNHVAIKGAAGPILADPLLGDATGPLEAFVAAAQGGVLPMKVDPAIRNAIYTKLLFNTCMNLIGALTGMTYGELVPNPYTLGLIARLAEEAQAVLNADSGFRPATSGAAYARHPRPLRIGRWCRAPILDAAGCRGRAPH